MSDRVIPFSVTAQASDSFSTFAAPTVNPVAFADPVASQVSGSSVPVTDAAVSILPVTSTGNSASGASLRRLTDSVGAMRTFAWNGNLPESVSEADLIGGVRA